MILVSRFLLLEFRSTSRTGLRQGPNPQREVPLPKWRGGFYTFRQLSGSTFWFLRYQKTLKNMFLTLDQNNKSANQSTLGPAGLNSWSISIRRTPSGWRAWSNKRASAESRGIQHRLASPPPLASPKFGLRVSQGWLISSFYSASNFDIIFVVRCSSSFFFIILGSPWAHLGTCLHYFGIPFSTMNLPLILFFDTFRSRSQSAKPSAVKPITL